jgi:DNA-3-methyladenine glycosylase II
MNQKATVSIEPLAPFDLALSSLVFADGGRSVRGFHDGCFSQVIDVGSRLVWARLASEGCVNDPILILELYADGLHFSESEKQQAVKAVSHIFSLDLPLSSFYDHVQGDSVMAQVTQRLCGFKFPTTPTVFESLIDAIVEQQISIKVARNIEDRWRLCLVSLLLLAMKKFLRFQRRRLWWMRVLRGLGRWG